MGDIKLEVPPIGVRVLDKVCDRLEFPGKSEEGT